MNLVALLGRLVLDDGDSFVRVRYFESFALNSNRMPVNECLLLYREPTDLQERRSTIPWLLRSALVQGVRSEEARSWSWWRKLLPLAVREPTCQSRVRFIQPARKQGVCRLSSRSCVEWQAEDSKFKHHFVRVCSHISHHRSLRNIRQHVTPYIYQLLLYGHIAFRHP